MLRITLWRAKRKAACAELKIREKEYKAALRAYAKTMWTIKQLENKIATYLEKS
ncbi:hypothetical protein UFOVP1457_45 [uncultured Caudovirales phage]|jgi:hypothetical protein|uniref:Uncharacterized protein n=1 Tax=uncultured Caudovirales phage TaxID=2100421 RepID=A0A6J5SK60_9CAUD|nr:hypothetical protein UFOVP1457_45 [uncultured Caudovirales phage]